MEQFDQNDKIELTQQQPKQPEKINWKKEVFEWSEAIIIAVVIAVIIRSFCLRLLRLKGIHGKYLARRRPPVCKKDRLYSEKR